MSAVLPSRIAQQPRPESERATMAGLQQELDRVNRLLALSRAEHRKESVSSLQREKAELEDLVRELKAEVTALRRQLNEK